MVGARWDCVGDGWEAAINLTFISSSISVFVRKSAFLLDLYLAWSQ